MTEVGSKVNLRWVTAENNENNFVTRSKKKVEQKTNHLTLIWIGWDEIIRFDRGATIASKTA